MDFLKKLFGGSPAQPERNYHTFSVKCLRCGEIIEGRVDLSNDLSVEYEDGGDIFYARKTLMGGNILVFINFNNYHELKLSLVNYHLIPFF